MGNSGEPTEVTPTFVVVLPQAYKRPWWNRVPLVENISMKILVDGDRYRTMGRNEREPPHAQRIVLPAFGRLWHFEESVTDVVIRMSRQFIGGLPADIQEKYAYQNAQKVFGRFITPNP